MKNIFVAIHMLVCGLLPLWASEPLVVDKLIHKTTDLSASNAPKDMNGNPCGLLKVITNDKSMTFEGSVIGIPEYKNGEYWVYLPQGTYQLKLKSDKNDPLLLSFRDYNIDKVTPKSTYELTFNIHEYKPLFIDQFKVLEGKPVQKKYVSRVLTVPDKSYAQSIIRQIKADTELAELCSISLIGNLSDGEVESYSVIATSSDDELEVILLNALFSGVLNPEILVLTK